MDNPISGTEPKTTDSSDQESTENPQLTKKESDLAEMAEKIAGTAGTAISDAAHRVSNGIREWFEDDRRKEFVAKAKTKGAEWAIVARGMGVSAAKWAGTRIQQLTKERSSNVTESSSESKLAPIVDVVSEQPPDDYSETPAAEDDSIGSNEGSKQATKSRKSKEKIIDSIKCPNCNAEFEADDDLDGVNVACPICNNQFTVSLQQHHLENGLTGHNRKKLTLSAYTRVFKNPKIAWIVVVLLLFIMIGSMFRNDQAPDATQNSKKTARVTEEKPANQKRTKTESIHPAPAPTLNVSKSDTSTSPPKTAISSRESRVLEKARSWLQYSAFSHDGLIKRLESDHCSKEEATYGADNCGADWNQQALRSAHSWLRYSPFSHDGLVKRLKADDFSKEQATYGADNCGADWNQQALNSTQSWLRYSAFSHDGLIKRLKADGYTKEEAIYGADNCGADWNEQALIAANKSIDSSPKSYLGLIKLLKYEGFSHAEAVYGADNCDADWYEQAAKSAEHTRDYNPSYSIQRIVNLLLYEGFTNEQAWYGVGQAIKNDTK